MAGSRRYPAPIEVYRGCCPGLEPDQLWGCPPIRLRIGEIKNHNSIRFCFMFALRELQPREFYFEPLIFRVLALARRLVCSH